MQHPAGFIVQKLGLKRDIRNGYTKQHIILISCCSDYPGHTALSLRQKHYIKGDGDVKTKGELEDNIIKLAGEL